MSETMPAIDKVFGSIMDATIDFSIARGFSPNKALKNMAPSINALPRESFFLIQNSTRIKTIITLTIAGMCSIIDISFYLKRLQKLCGRSHVLERPWIYQIVCIGSRRQNPLSGDWPLASGFLSPAQPVASCKKPVSKLRISGFISLDTYRTQMYIVDNRLSLAYPIRFLGYKSKS